jgi:hypothetical protein
MLGNKKDDKRMSARIKTPDTTPIPDKRLSANVTTPVSTTRMIPKESSPQIIVETVHEPIQKEVRIVQSLPLESHVKGMNNPKILVPSDNSKLKTEPISVKEKKTSHGHQMHTLQDSVEETRNSLEDSTKRKIRANYSPSIIVRELPSDEKSDVDDLADLLGPVVGDRK